MKFLKPTAIARYFHAEIPRYGAQQFEKKMASDSDLEITSLLKAAEDGEPGAIQRLFDRVYIELKKIAKNRITAANHSTTQTTLVHETYLRMVKDERATWSDRHHFFWAAARAMRDILVERARHDGAAKRGGRHFKVELGEEMLADSQSPDLLDLNDALERLESSHPDAAKIVELRFFAGLTREQIAEIMNISPSAVWRQWAFARAWLSHALDGSSE